MEGINDGGEEGSHEGDGGDLEQNKGATDTRGDMESGDNSSANYSDHITCSPTVLKRTAAMWILKVKERHKLPTSVMEGLIEDISSLFQVHIGELHSSVLKHLHGAGVTEEFTSGLSSIFNCHAKPFSGLETNYAQQKYLKETFNIVVSIIWILEL